VFFLFLDPQNKIGPSISFSVVLCSFVLLVYIVMLVLVFCLCPSYVRIVTTFPGTVLFPLLYSVLFEMWCWRRMEKISWTDHVRNEEVLLRVKEQRNILHKIRKWKANWIGHILRRICLLQRVIEGKIQRGIEVTERQGRRRRKLLDDLKERRGYSHLKEEALDRAMWRARFGRGFRPVVRQTAKRMK